MIFKEDWWVVPLIIILGFLLLYQICNSGNNSGDSDNSSNSGKSSGIGARNYNPAQHK